jgi:hypothetical protein
VTPTSSVDGDQVSVAVEPFEALTARPVRAEGGLVSPVSVLGVTVTTLFDDVERRPMVSRAETAKVYCLVREMFAVIVAVVTLPTVSVKPMS